MAKLKTESLQLKDPPVSALWCAGAEVRACLVLAHSAGAGMDQPQLAAVATGLAARGIASLRYQFPYMEQKSRRPDSPRVCYATVRAAVATAAKRTDVPLFAGGRSFGGRMTSQAQALQPLPRVRGLVFLAFPLHASGKPSDERADHLPQVSVPMLFVQGTRDALAELPLLEPIVKTLGKRASLIQVADADHSFHVPARSGRTDADVLEEIIEATAAWMLQRAS